VCVTDAWLFFSFLRLDDTPLYWCTTLSTLSTAFIDGPLGCFYLLAMVNVLLCIWVRNIPVSSPFFGGMVMGLELRLSSRFTSFSYRFNILCPKCLGPEVLQVLTFYGSWNICAYIMRCLGTPEIHLCFI
jgi:hypothetical protein